MKTTIRSLILFLFIFCSISFSTVSFTPAYSGTVIIKKAEGECTYWITRSSHKRHNSNCRWYKNSKGYCTDNPNEGVACKICGG